MAAGLHASKAIDCSRPRADASAAVVDLWPPNHKVHLVSIDKCLPAYAGCGDELDAVFDWASSDEPIDDIGDGHHAPDIFRVDPKHVCVRSERQGPKNGRTYRLGIVLNGSGDDPLRTECIVAVDHDQRGVLARDDGEAYRIAFDDADDGATCEAGPNAGDEPDAPRPPRAPKPPVPTPDEDPPVQPRPPRAPNPPAAPPTDAPDGGVAPGDAGMPQ